MCRLSYVHVCVCAMCVCQVVTWGHPTPCFTHTIWCTPAGNCVCVTSECMRDGEVVTWGLAVGPDNCVCACAFVPQEMSDEVVTWGLAAGPDNALYSAADEYFPVSHASFVNHSILHTTTYNHDSTHQSTHNSFSVCTLCACISLHGSAYIDTVTCGPFVHGPTSTPTSPNKPLAAPCN